MSKDLGKFLTPAFRISFPKVFELDTYGGGEGKYTLDAIWEEAKFSPADKKLWAALLAAMDTACLATFKKKRLELPGTHRLALRDGTEKTSDGYGEGKTFAKLASSKAFGVVDVNNKPIGPTHGNAHEIYSGCYARAFVRPYTFNGQGKGVRLVILSLQKLADGKRLGDGATAENDFANEAVDTAHLEQHYDSVGSGWDDEVAF